MAIMYMISSPAVSCHLVLLGDGQLEGLVGVQVHELYLISGDGEHLGLALVDHRDLHLVLDRMDDLPLAVVKDADGIDVGFRFSVLPRLGGGYADDLAGLPIDEHVSAFLELPDFLLSPRHSYQWRELALRLYNFLSPVVLVVFRALTLALPQ
jgi:hypothetical protein